MATKFRLDPAPTFSAKVGIPIPGGRSEAVAFTFKWRDREGIREFFEALPEPRPDGESVSVDEAVEADVKVILDAASGWELAEPFDAESLRKLCRNYPRAGQAIVDTYLDELTKGREKN